MSTLTQTVPVKLEDSLGGFAENAGLLRLDGETLVLEFDSRLGGLDFLKSEVKRFAIALAELESCRWKPGWLGGTIELGLRSMARLGEIPGAAQGEVKLTVARRHRDRALGLVSSVELALAHRVLREVENTAILPAVAADEAQTGR